MGASQVVTLNCPRLAYRADKDVDKYIDLTKKAMDTCIEIFKIKRKWTAELISANRIPFATQRPKDPITRERGSQAVDFDGLVYTIGIIGINEVVQHLTGKQLHESSDAVKLALRLMLEMKRYAAELSGKHGFTIAFARTPAETTAQRFAVADLMDKRYRKDAEAVVKGNLSAALKNLGKKMDLPIYYTNGTHVFPGAPINLTQRIAIEGKFFPLIDGGNILHIWMGEKKPDPEGLMDFTMNLCQNTNVGYFAFTRDITISKNEYRWRRS